MKESDLKERALTNVHKIVFMVNEYPKKSMAEIAQLFQLPPIDINLAIWRAQDLGYLTVDEKGIPTIHKIPEEWKLGDLITELQGDILYLFERLARDEMDLEDNMFGSWCAGYPTHDVMIAVKKLLNDRKIADYEIKDYYELPLSKKKKGRGEKPTRKENIYTFYTLTENVENRWGEKQFKERDGLK